MKKIVTFILTVAFLPLLVYSQEKLHIQLANQYILDSLSYIDESDNYQFIGDTLYYLAEHNNISTIYKKTSERGISRPVFKYKSSSDYMGVS